MQKACEWSVLLAMHTNLLHKIVVEGIGLVSGLVCDLAISSLLADIPGWEHIVEISGREICNHRQKANKGEQGLNKFIINLHLYEVSLPSSNVLYLKLRSNCFASALGKPAWSIFVLEKRMRFMDRPALLMAASYILFCFYFY